MCEYLYDYSADDSSNAYTVIQKYRKLNDNCYRNMVIPMWDKGKKELADKMIQKILNFVDQKEEFYVSTPASNIDVFVSYLLQQVKEAFPRAIDLSSYMKKTKNIEVGLEENRQMTEQEIEEIIEVDRDGMKSCIAETANKFVIIDDVYSTGRSIRVCYKIISNIIPNINSKYKIVILKNS
ncbi:MAG: hypothetical protein C0596_13820 [Marinilabiliales bacterium]|nr:MAG: hypothetical protein C0596_13820 [Marinilabiliales bacterium]